MIRSKTVYILDKARSGKERREFIRTKGDLELSYVVVSGKDKRVVSKSCRAKLEDLSLGGLSFKTNEIVVDGLHISSNATSNGSIKNGLILQFQLPFLSSKIKATCKVIWYELVERLTEPIYAVGVQFLGLQPEYQAAITRQVNSIIGERAPLQI
jgi:c-di-GMP-binding flagellar brake protein YcgR